MSEDLRYSEHRFVQVKRNYTYTSHPQHFYLTIGPHYHTMHHRCLFVHDQETMIGYQTYQETHVHGSHDHHRRFHRVSAQSYTDKSDIVTNCTKFEKVD